MDGPGWQILEGDVRERDLDDESVQTCVTSPPYWGLRDYGTGGQLGLEPTPEEYVANLVAVFREVRRVLRDDGTLWLNLGDSYANPGHYKGNPGDHGTIGRPRQADQETAETRYRKEFGGLKNKDLCGIPWRVAFALQADGWWLRSDIIWNKPNPMPESVTDRPTRAHEYLFLLTKNARYFYDADAIREDSTPDMQRRADAGQVRGNGTRDPSRGDAATLVGGVVEANGRNKRSVWTVTTKPYPDAHFATFPPKLIEPCILAGSPPKCCGECGAPWERVVERSPMEVRASERAAIQGDGVNDRRTATSGTMTKPPESHTTGWRPTCRCFACPKCEGVLPDCYACGGSGIDRNGADDSGRSVVLDPFAGSGTTGLVALRHERSFVGIELNSDYCELARNRIRDDAPLLNTPQERC